jgi:hypothetical protein
MLFSFQALATVLLLSPAVFGAAVGSPENLQKRDKPKGIDVSSYQPDVNWDSVKRSGVTFAYIKATEGTSEYDDIFIVRCGDISLRLQELCVQLPVH